MSRKSLHSVAMLLYKGVASSDVAGPMECFGLANYISGRDLYELTTVSADGLPLASAGDWVKLQPIHSFKTLPGDIDTLIIPGGPAAFMAAQDEKITHWIRDRGVPTVRVCSICNGAFIMAASGVARHARLATHWLYAQQLAKLYPDLEVDPDAIFVRSGNIWSSGGMTSGMDMALAIIEEDCGRILAMEVARQMVLYLRRAGGQSQFSMHLKAQFAELPLISRLQQWIIDNPSADLRIEALADHIAMSKRSLLRLFKDETGVTLGEFITDARLRHACALLEETEREQKEIASLAGLGSEANLRKVFMTRLKITPSQYRARFRAGENQATAPGGRLQFHYDSFWLHRTEVIDFRRAAGER